MGRLSHVPLWHLHQNKNKFVVCTTISLIFLPWSDNILSILSPVSEQKACTWKALPVAAKMPSNIWHLHTARPEQISPCRCYLPQSTLSSNTCTGKDTSSNSVCLWKTTQWHGLALSRCNTTPDCSWLRIHVRLVSCIGVDGQMNTNTFRPPSISCKLRSCLKAH